MFDVIAVLCDIFLFPSFIAILFIFFYHCCCFQLVLLVFDQNSTGKDLFWYARDKKSQQSDMDAAKEEIRRIKEEEEQAMREALGLAPKRAAHSQGNRLDKHEFSELVKRGSTAEDLGAGHAEAARVHGLGFSK